MAEAVPSLGERMKEARLQTAVRRRETVSQAMMAELVSRELKRPLAQAQWSRYELDESEPPLAIIRAAANVSGLSEAYIAFGNRLLDSVKVHKLTEEQVELAKRVAESERRERQQQEKRQKGRGKAG